LNGNNPTPNGTPLSGIRRLAPRRSDLEATGKSQKQKGLSWCFQREQGPSRPWLNQLNVVPSGTGLTARIWRGIGSIPHRQQS
jgi:hypothetical protein